MPRHLSWHCQPKGRWRQFPRGGLPVHIHCKTMTPSGKTIFHPAPLNLLTKSKVVSSSCAQKRRVLEMDQSAAGRIIVAAKWAISKKGEEWGKRLWKRAKWDISIDRMRGAPFKSENECPDGLATTYGIHFQPLSDGISTPGSSKAFIRVSWPGWRERERKKKTQVIPLQVILQ